MYDYIDRIRRDNDFLTPHELVAGVGAQNTIFDPNSVLISEGVRIGVGNIFYPNVTIEQQGDGRIVLSDNNVLHSGTYFLCAVGVVRVGDGNTFGPSGVIMQSNAPGSSIIIGDEGRYNRAEIMGRTTLGSGSQVLGLITVQDCILAAGGNFKESDPDQRAAVLKGFGLARGITLETGRVMNGAGDFSQATAQWQHEYHPKAGKT